MHLIEMPKSVWQLGENDFGTAAVHQANVVPFKVVHSRAPASPCQRSLGQTGPRPLPQVGLALGAGVAAVGIHVAARIVRIEEQFEHSGVADGGVCHGQLANHLATLVDAGVHLVTEVVLAMFFGPARIDVFLGPLVRETVKSCGGRALVFQRVVGTLVELLQHQDLHHQERRIRRATTFGARWPQCCGIDVGGQGFEVHMRGQANQRIADRSTPRFAFMISKQTGPGLHHVGFFGCGRKQNFTDSSKGAGRFLEVPFTLAPASRTISPRNQT
jgi:hypothetical protein